MVVDQAYLEFGGDDFSDLIATENLVICRTLSKAWALASLRVGTVIRIPSAYRRLEIVCRIRHRLAEMHEPSRPPAASRSRRGVRTCRDWTATA